MTNCPNCGAPVVSSQCEYCGTVFVTPKQSTREDIPEWHAPISLVEAYKQGEIVRYGGVLRRSLIDRNVFTPTHDSVWQTVETI